MDEVGAVKNYDGHQAWTLAKFRWIDRRCKLKKTTSPRNTQSPKAAKAFSEFFADLMAVDVVKVTPPKARTRRVSTRSGSESGYEITPARAAAAAAAKQTPAASVPADDGAQLFLFENGGAN